MKIALIESNALLRKGLSLFLNEQNEIKVTVSGEPSIDLYGSIRPENVDLILFDTTEDSEFRNITQIKKRHPKVKMILLSEKERLFENYLYAAMNNVDAFFFKNDTRPELLLYTIRELQNIDPEELLIHPDLKATIFDEIEVGKTDFFSKREIEILELIQKGKTNKEISIILNISTRTIEAHRSRMIERMDCKSILPVILYALEHKFIELIPNQYECSI